MTRNFITLLLVTSIGLSPACAPAKPALIDNLPPKPPVRLEKANRIEQCKYSAGSRLTFSDGGYIYIGDCHGKCSWLLCPDERDCSKQPSTALFIGEDFDTMRPLLATAPGVKRRVKVIERRVEPGCRVELDSVLDAETDEVLYTQK